MLFWYKSEANLTSINTLKAAFIFFKVKLKDDLLSVSPCALLQLKTTHNAHPI